MWLHTFTEPLQLALPKLQRIHLWPWRTWQLGTAWHSLAQLGATSKCGMLSWPRPWRNPLELHACWSRLDGLKQPAATTCTLLYIINSIWYYSIIKYLRLEMGAYHSNFQEHTIKLAPGDPVILNCANGSSEPKRGEAVSWDTREMLQQTKQTLHVPEAAKVWLGRSLGVETRITLDCIDFQWFQAMSDDFSLFCDAFANFWALVKFV